MDKMLRNKLNDHASELPHDMWSRIEVGMKEEKKSRGLFYYFVGGLGIILLALAFYFTWPYTLNNNVPDHEHFSQIAETPVEHKSSLPALESEVEEKPTATNRENPDSGISDNQSLTTFEPNVAQTNQNLAQTVEETKSIPSLEINTEGQSKLDIMLAANISDSDENANANDFTKTKDTEIYKQSTADLIQLKSLSLFPLAINDRKFGDPKGCPAFSSRKTINLFVETHYSPLSAMKLLSSNSPEIGEDYLDLRRNSERSLYSWSAGLNIGYLASNNFGIKAGVNYEVINERFVYEDPQALRNQTIIVIDTIFNSDGSVTVNLDTSVVQVIGYETLQIHNYHKSVEIPLHLSYYFDFDRIDFEVSGGPNINIDYSNRGKIVDPSNEDQWFTNGENGSYNVFKDRLSLSFSLDVSAFYNVTENIQIYARPNFKFHPNSMTTVSSPSNQRYAIVGLAAGARYYFSGNPNY